MPVPGHMPRRSAPASSGDAPDGHPAPFPAKVGSGGTQSLGSSETPPQTASASPAHPDIAAALEKLLASPEFRSAPQLQSFLTFVVRSLLDGRSDRLKGYTIAVEALGRGADFDPVADPIVRVEAGRLRRRLAKYYSGSGTGETLRISIPKGSYAPRFETRPPATGTAPPEPGPSPDPDGERIAPTPSASPGEHLSAARDMTRAPDPGTDSRPKPVLPPIDPVRAVERPASTKRSAGQAFATGYHAVAARRFALPWLLAAVAVGILGGLLIAAL